MKQRRTTRITEFSAPAPALPTTVATDPAAPAVPAVVPAALLPGQEPWNAILAVEGTPTGDGRLIGPGALTWRELPLPLMFQPKTGDYGHVDSYCVGRIDTITRDGALIRGTGVVFQPNPADDDDPIQALLNILQGGLPLGPSIDLDDMVIEMADFDEAMMAPGLDTMSVSSARIIAATVVATPAFAETVLALGTDPVQPRAGTDATSSPAPTLEQAAPPEPTPVAVPVGEGELAATPAPAAPASGQPDGATQADGTVISVGDHVLATLDGQDQPVEATVTAADSTAGTVDLELADGTTQTGVPVDNVAAAPADQTEGDSGPTAGLPASGAAMLAASASTSAAMLAAGPLAPPAEWFADPQFGASPEDDPRLALDAETGQIGCPLTVTDDGRVYGHVATWGTCHTGFPDTCITAPEEPDYEFFMRGETVARDGRRFATGALTLGGGHADPRAGFRAAIEHYDDASATVADVIGGRDGYGIWVAGALRSTITDDQLRAMRAAPLSGDWRRIGGRLRMVAAHCVNVPGFPIPRPKLASVGGVQVSLAAAGVIVREHDVEPPTVREQVAGFIGRKRRADHLARLLGRTPADRARQLAQLVHGA